MTQIVKTGTPMLRELVCEALRNSTRVTTRRVKGARYLRHLKMLGKEELERRYQAAKAFNIKHGISPQKYRKKRVLPLEASRGTGAKITLATKVTFLD